MASPLALATALDQEQPQDGLLGGIAHFFRPWTPEDRARVAAVMPPDLAPTQIVKGALGGVGSLAMQANEAMPWGRNNPQAIGIYPDRAAPDSYPAATAGGIDPNVMIPFATDVAGMATTGSLAAPAVQGAVGMGVRTAAKGGKNVDMSTIRSIGDLRAAIDENGGKLYVRWSAGPKYDMKPGAVSRDYQNGATHDGLSALELTNDLSDWELNKWLIDYSYLIDKNRAQTSPHIYAAERIGRDSDGGPTIRPTKHVGGLDKQFLDLLSDDNTAKRISLMDSIKQNEYALELYKREPPKYLTGYTAESLAKSKAELEALGGPLPDWFFAATKPTTGGRF